MNSAGADFEDEEHVHPAQQHRVDGEEVTRQYRLRLDPAELPPRRAAASRSRIQSSSLQDVPDRRRRNSVSEPSEFAMDAAVTPRRVLPGEPDRQLPDYHGDSGTSPNWLRLRRVSPVPSDQLSVPAQQRRRRHDPHTQQLARQQPRQRRKHHPVRRLQPRTTHLPAQHRHLMPKNKQLDILNRLAPSPETQPGQAAP